MQNHPAQTIKRSLWQALWLLSVVMIIASPVYAQGPIAVTGNEHEHEFQGPMTFRLAAQSSDEINSIELFYRVSGQTAAHKVVLEFDPNTAVQVEHTEDMGDEENYQPPMITFTYWWVIEDEGGNRLKTEAISFPYIDTRYTWQVLENDQVRLYWHDQDLEFGQGYFELAADAARELSTEFGVTPKEAVAIVIYNSHQELMSVLQEASSEWTGAVNFGDRGCIAIGLGANSWMQQVIPHELTHAMLDQITQPPFGEIPRWLHEGLAVRSEGGMSIEERAALADAIEEDSLISLRVLNSPFPDSRERAILSYAESSSLVSFILEEYGTEKLGDLLVVFAEGAHYDDAMMQVFGVDMDGMEDLWRAHIGAPPRAGVSQATPLPQITSTPTRVLEETKIPIPPIAATATAVAAAPIPTPTRTPQKAATPARAPLCAPRLPCLGATPVLLVLAFFVASRARTVR